MDPPATGQVDQHGKQILYPLEMFWVPHTVNKFLQRRQNVEQESPPMLLQMQMQVQMVHCALAGVGGGAWGPKSCTCDGDRQL